MHTLKEIIATIDTALSQAEDSGPKIRPDLFATEADQLYKYVLVRIGDNNLALPISGLAEVGPLPHITGLPNLPSWILGISNLRGEIISVIDLNSFLAPDNSPSLADEKLAVLASGKLKLGICIDQVVATISRTISDTREISDADLAQTAPEVFTHGIEVNGTLYHILKIEEFLSMKRLNTYYSESAAA